MATDYWVMENALEYTDPKVVVIDCFGLSGNNKSSISFSQLHLSLDAFPLSATKIKTIWDLLDDPVLEEELQSGIISESVEPRTKMELLWDYSVYHSRWTEIEQSDFEPELTYEKGAESRIGVIDGAFNKIPPGRKMEPGTTSEQYLRRMIEECQDIGIEVLLIYLPFSADENYQMEANYVYDIAGEYGVNYINFLDMDLVNYQTDLYDGAAHLNPSGARKVSDYLGEYLTSNYDIPDQRDNEDYSFWHEDYEEYIEMKDRHITWTNNIVEYLVLLAGDHADIAMDIRNTDIFNNDRVVEALENLGIDADELTEDTDFIIIRNGGEKAAVINELRDEGEAAVTGLGNVQIFYDTEGSHNNGESGYYGLYLDGNECLAGNMNDSTSLQISVTRGEVAVDTVRFVYTVDAETTMVNTYIVDR